MADTDVSELNSNLRKEENDMVPGRGLQDTDKQTFEIFLTSEFRRTYDKIYGIVIGSVCICANTTIVLASKLV
jgi:hypothetical protein